VWVTVDEDGDPVGKNVCCRARAYDGLTPVEVVACVEIPSETLPGTFFKSDMSGAIADEYALLLLVPSEGWDLATLPTDLTPVNPTDDPTYFD
jgi:hypothetical protein